MVKRNDKTNTGEGDQGKKDRTVSDGCPRGTIHNTSLIKVKDKRRTKNNNLEFLIGWRWFPDPKDDTWESLGHLSGSEHMIREFNEQWEKRMLRTTISR
jgi:hypothetical protein